MYFIVFQGVTYSTQILQSFGSQKTSIVESGKTGLNHVSQAIVNVQKPIIQKVPFKITPELYISEVSRIVFFYESIQF